MARSITQYRVFIATPGGLDDERNAFRKTLETYTASDAEPRGVTFHPVGWEETIGGVGRPQELINEDLRQCDYAIFLWHDRWGSPTGNGATVGTEEEWNLAEKLYQEGRVRNIAVFFKKVDERQLRSKCSLIRRIRRSDTFSKLMTSGTSSATSFESTSHSGSGIMKKARTDVP